MGLKNEIRLAEKMMAEPWLMQTSQYEIMRVKFDLYQKDPNAFIRNIWEKGVAQGLLEKPKNEENSNDDKNMQPKGDFFADLFGIKAPAILEFDRDNKKATINVTGSLVDIHTCATIVEGFTSYADIGAAIDEIVEDGKAETVIFNFDSPGGMVSGVDALSQKIKSMEIHTIAHINDMAASAAFWLASQTDEIVAKSRTAFVGSIGVVIEFFDGTRALKDAGFDKVQLVSDGAPDKRPDLETSEGRRKIISRLNDIHNVFVERVASGRGVSTAIVTEKFGRGDVVISSKAILVNMIDKIEDGSENKSNTSETEISVEENVDLKALLDSNPGAKIEHESAITVASDNAVKIALEANEKKREESTKSNIEIASKILLSDTYPKAVKGLAIQVAAGKTDATALNTTVAVFDQQAEQILSDKADLETKNDGDTPPVVDGEESKDGVIRSAEDMKAAVERMKQS